MAGQPLRVLVVEDSEDDCMLLVRTLKKEGYDVKHQRVDSADKLLANLHRENWDIVISDFSMPGFTGTGALELVRKNGLDVPFVFVSGTIGEETAVDAMRRGAQDYVMKGNLKRLLPAIQRELREYQLRREHKEIEKRMRQLEKFEAIGRLAGGIAHDFNNVIAAIMGWAELGLDEVQPDTRASRFFQQIRNHSERAAGLTRQLLAFARRQILEPQNLDLNQVTRETSVLLEKLLSEQIELEMHLASDLKTIRADRSQIEQVLMNLCVNARDAMPKGGKLTIETSNAELDEEYCRNHICDHPGSYVRVSVSDTGTGMDAATVERIFEPFFTTKEVGKGTGLGLATAMGVITQHGGSIDVVTELGRGTTFHVFLPVSTRAAEANDSRQEAPVAGGNETVLVVDDHDGVRETTREILQKLGYRIIVAKDGQEAVREFTNHAAEVSLVILDVVMPKLSGPDAYDRILEIRRDVPVIFTSGYSDEVPSLTPMLGARAILLQKPYTPKLLGQKIRELLDQKVAADRVN
jgi:two-component system cell cycle sensor histidine kinase/response regulator CckA